MSKKIENIIKGWKEKFDTGECSQKSEYCDQTTEMSVMPCKWGHVFSLEHYHAQITKLLFFETMDLEHSVGSLEHQRLCGTINLKWVLKPNYTSITPQWGQQPGANIRCQHPDAWVKLASLKQEKVFLETEVNKETGKIQNSEAFQLTPRLKKGKGGGLRWGQRLTKVVTGNGNGRRNRA